MSDYPSAPPFGANYGGQNPPNPSYLPPNYPVQYSQPDDSHMAQHQYGSNYEGNMSAYGYNGAAPAYMVPNLATAPMSMYQGWNQDHAPVPPYNVQHNALQHNGYSSNLYSYDQGYPTPQESYQPNVSSAKPYDEGEVSEGEFDSRYMPQNPTHSGYNATPYGGSGYIDTAHRAVYPRNQDPPPVPTTHPGNSYNYYHEASHNRRQGSDSYSPYEGSLGDGRHDEHAVNQQHGNPNPINPTLFPDRYENGPTQVQNKASWDQNRNMNTSSSGSQANGNHATVSNNSVVANRLPLTKATSTQPSPSQALPCQVPIQNFTKETSAQAPPKPVTPIQQAPQIVYDKAELRKKAEAAILNLLPHDVRYEKYMEEGIAEDVVGPLFDHLRLPRTPSKSSNNAGQQQKLLHGQKLSTTASFAPSERQHGPPSTTQSNSLPQAQNDHYVAGTISTATTLSEQNNKASSNGLTTSPSATSLTQAATGTATEKERTLKLKMEALRKSREERAQKAAANKINARPAPLPVPAPEVPPSEVVEPEISQPTPTTNTSEARSTILVPLTSTNSQLPQIHPANPQLQTHNIISQQPPSIPGLFLASTANRAISPANSATNNIQANSRKRPVAADFVTSSTLLPFKRPFGQNRSDTPLVIDVSEDEDEDEDSDDGDVAMDLDSQADQDSPIHAVSKIPDQRSLAIQNLPMLTNFPARKPFTPPQTSSTASTPPMFVPTRKPTLGRPEDLQAKELQIEELRRKIAEAEAAKAHKKAQQSASRTQTPGPVSSNNDSMTIASDTVAKKVETSIQIQNMIDVAENKVNQDQKRLLQAQALEAEKAAELRRKESDIKRLRREKIATDLPRVDAEVLEKKRKLEQLKAQMAEIEAEVEKNLREKQRMAEEMERLGQEAEDQLQAQKDKLNDLTQPERPSNNVIPALPSPQGVQAEDITPTIPIDVPQLLDPIQIGSPENVEESEVAPTEREPSTPIQNGTPITEPNDHQIKPVSSDHHPQLETRALSENANGTLTADQDLEEALQDAVRAEGDSHDGHRDDEDMNIENSYAPDPDQLAPKSPSDLRREDYRSPSYSPVLGRVTTNVSDIQSDADYEPPEATPVDEPSPIQSPPFSPAPAEAVTEEDSHDLIIFPSNSGALVTDDLKTVEDSLPRTNGIVPVLTNDISGDKSDPPNFFTPYESPLRQFRAYRFHPSFSQEVSGGFKSLTYSNKIDANLEMCPWEMAGGACNDNTCQFQHMKDIILPDDAILTALGSPDDYTGEQRKQFCDGLREVLTGLRARKIRDFTIIAQEVVAQRARFRGDSSKILMLEGTAI